MTTLLQMSDLPLLICLYYFYIPYHIAAFEHYLYLRPCFLVDDRFGFSGINVAFMFSHTDVKLIVALLPIALDTFPGNQGFAPGYISIQVPLRARFKASPPLFYRFAYRLRAAAIVLAEQAAGRRLFNLYGLSSLFRF